ncbi:MAG: hypothetical protein NVS1B4_12270 [Gemmatimonadaceae bacterium]
MDRYRLPNRTGEWLAERGPLQSWTCEVERSQLRRYLPPTVGETFAIFQQLPRFIALARTALTESGDLPPAAAV